MAGWRLERTLVSAVWTGYGFIVTRFMASLLIYDYTSIHKPHNKTVAKSLHSDLVLGLCFSHLNARKSLTHVTATPPLLDC